MAGLAPMYTNFSSYSVFVTSMVRLIMKLPEGCDKTKAKVRFDLFVVISRDDLPPQ